MAADEEAKGTAKSGGSGDDKPPEGKTDERRERKRTPVTIDLKAEKVRADASGSAGAKPDAAAKQEPAAKSAAAAKPETAAKPDASADRSHSPQAERAQSERIGTFAGTTAARAIPKIDDRTRLSVFAGVAGGVIALILVIVLQAIGILPAPGRSAADAAAEQARAAADATAGMERRLSAVEAMVEGIPAMRTDIGRLGDGVAALQSTNGSLAAKSDLESVVAVIGQLRQRIDALPPAASRDDLDGLAERIGRLEVSVAAGGGDASGSEAAIASLSTKLGEAETALRSLTERLAAAEAQMSDTGIANSTSSGDAAVKAIAITALRRAAEGGRPFASEVDMIAALGISGSEIAALRPYADRGVPAETTVMAEFPAVADAILAASATSDPNAGFFQHLMSGLGGLVSIRPAGPIAGGDPPAIVSRMIAAVETGDLAIALSERDGLPEGGREASAAWASNAADRVALDTLVERIARSLGVSTG